MDTGFDVVEFSNPGMPSVVPISESLLSQISRRRCPARIPAVRKPQRVDRLAARSGLPAATGAAIGLQDAVEALQELFGMLTAGLGTASARSVRSRAPTTLCSLSTLGLRSPDSAL